MLEVSHLTYAHGAHVAIEDISLQVPDGQLVAIAGPSGCGKSTLLRCIAGLLRPTGGQVVLNGLPVTRVPDGLAVVFQDYSRSLYPWLSVRDNVVLPLRRTEPRRAVRRERALRALADVGLADAAVKYPWQLSGGMQQRAAIVRAFGLQPDVLLMDEPFSALDEFTRESLQDQLLGLWDELKTTVLFVTHSVSEAVRLSDTVVVMAPRPGRVADVVDVDLPRPRRERLFEERGFHEYEDLIRDRLRSAWRSTDAATAGGTR